jgi:hypothetical protein
VLREDAIRIRHMVEAAESTEGFIAGRQRTDLDSDRMLLFQCRRCRGRASSRCVPVRLRYGLTIVTGAQQQLVPSALAARPNGSNFFGVDSS